MCLLAHWDRGKSQFCLYITHLFQQEWWFLSPRTSSEHLRHRWIPAMSTGHNLITAWLRACAAAYGVPSSGANSMASINKCWQTSCFANTFTGLLLMLTLGILSSAVLSPAITLIGFFPLATAHLTIYLNGFLASSLSVCSHAKSTNTCSNLTFGLVCHKFSIYEWLIECCIPGVTCQCMLQWIYGSQAAIILLVMDGKVGGHSS